MKDKLVIEKRLNMYRCFQCRLTKIKYAYIVVMAELTEIEHAIKILTENEEDTTSIRRLKEAMEEAARTNTTLGGTSGAQWRSNILTEQHMPLSTVVMNAASSYQESENNRGNTGMRNQREEPTLTENEATGLSDLHEVRGDQQAYSDTPMNMELAQLDQQEQYRREVILGTAELPENPSYEFDAFIDGLLTNTGTRREPVVMPTFNGEAATRKPTENYKIGHFYSKKIEFGKEDSRMAINIVLPPNKPICIVIGASHARKMSEIDFSAAAPNPQIDQEKLARGLWTCTSFVECRGDAKNTLPHLNFIISFILDAIMERNEMNGRGSTVIFLPFSWDAAEGVPLNDYAASLVNAAQIFYEAFSTIRKSKNWILDLQFSELPLSTRNQTRMFKINHIIRDVNSLINIDHAPIRSWFRTLRKLEDKETSNKRCTAPNFKGYELSYEDADKKHLRNSGYILWLAEMYDSGVLRMTDLSSEDDFNMTAVVHIPGEKSTYLARTHQARIRALSDPSNFKFANMLRILSTPNITADLLNQTYKEPEIITVDGGGAMRHTRGRGGPRNEPYLRGVGGTFGAGRRSHNRRGKWY